MLKDNGQLLQQDEEIKFSGSGQGLSLSVNETKKGSEVLLVR